ncbi:cocaine esterase-like [Physella acuta]|uniref:cocaine esterase-like n=1 Tax=Physella acuta TaxID=109671 RepID=UPI0027DBE655|nr:cocaine esterase-like [Physella acuta]
MLLRLLLCTLMAYAALVESLEFTVINTPMGQIKGAEVMASNNKTYWSFRGVPYAKPPVGPLRFAKPEPLQHRDGIFDATVPGYSCVQDNFFLLPGEKVSEDCLSLSIYVKDFRVTRNSAKKVVVWFHGGAFLFGSASVYDAGSFVTDYDVIVVSVQYRLGVLGFLSSENDASPGNYGLWDQALALRWVKSHIAWFGGDPDDIALAGESAGAASVLLLSLSPTTKGLFTKVYAHSGTPTGLFARYHGAKSDAILLAKEMNCTSGPSRAEFIFDQSVVNCLRSKSLSQLARPLSFDVTRAVYVPVVDGSFLPKPPSELLNDTHYLETIGFYSRKYFIVLNNNEQSAIDARFLPQKSIFYATSNGSDADKDALWYQFKKSLARSNIAQRYEVPDVSSQVVKTVTDWYEDRFVGDTAYQQLLTDLHFNIPAFDVLNAITQSKNTHVWLMYFNYYPHFMQGPYRGMIHSLDLCFWFDFPLPLIDKYLSAGATGSYDQRDRQIKRNFSTILAEFVKNGTTGAAISRIIPTGWPEYDNVGQYYLDFNQSPSIRRNLLREQRQLWGMVPPMISNNCL